MYIYIYMYTHTHMYNYSMRAGQPLPPGAAIPDKPLVNEDWLRGAQIGCVGVVAIRTGFLERDLQGWYRGSRRVFSEFIWGSRNSSRIWGCIMFV